MKKLVSLFLCLILLMGILPLTVTPVRAYSDGDWEYEINDGSAIITKYNGVGGKVTIPSTLGGKPVKEIGSRAFENCTSMTAVSIPKSVIAVGSGAFINCNALAQVNISDLAAWCAICFASNLYSNPLFFAHHLYLNGSEVTDLAIPFGVIEIGYQAFIGCTGIISVTIPNSVSHIGKFAFEDCTSLTAVTIPNSVTSIENGAFFGCSSLTSVTIPSSITSIGNSAFSGCSSLTSVTIPSSITSIGNSAFSGCSSLTRVDISDLAAWCAIEFGSDIGIISGANPLEYAHVLYLNGKAVTKLSIPTGVKRIGNCAFSGCSALRSVTIPDSVTSIGGNAFYDCSNLTRVDISNMVAWCNIEFGDNPLTYAKHLYLNGSEITELTIPESITRIGVSTFSGCIGLSVLTIPGSVTEIGSYAFTGCTGLTTLTIPESVTGIGSYAFSGCTGLTSVTIPKSVKTVSQSAFSGCTGLTSVTIKSGVKNIGANAFSGCTGLTSLTIPNSITTVGSGAFYSWQSSGLISAGPTGSGCNIQYGWTTSIPANAFSGLSGLQIAVIPATVNEIRQDAFFNCNLQRVYYGGTEEQWEEILALGGNNTLLNAEMHYGYKTGDPLIVASGSCGDSLTWTLDHKGKLTVSGTGIMNRSPFDYSTRQMIRSVVINNGATSVGSYAFSNCQDLTSVTIPKSVTSIGSGAFFGCTSLTEVYYGGTEAEWNTINTGYDNAPLTSATIHYTEPLDLTSVSANKTSAVAGDTLTWTASATGGSGTLKYYFILYKDGAKVTTRAYSTANSFTYTPTEPGTYRVRVYVKDSLDTKVNKLSSGVKVTGPITVTGITADKDHAAVGEVITWSASASGGEGTLQYWFRIYKDGTVVKKGTYGTAQTFTYIPTEPGTYKAKVYVKDAVGTTINKLSTAVPVTEPLAITGITANKTGAVTGETLTWTASAVGGSGMLKYYFILYKDGVKVTTRAYSTANTFSYTPAEPGTYKVRVYVKDSLDTKVNKLSSGVKATQAITVTGIMADKTSAVLGAAITWSAAAVGGEGTLQYWFRIYKDGTVVKKGTYGTVQAFTYTPTEPGVYKAKVYVKDAAGTTVSKVSTAVTVTEPLAITGITANKTSAVTGAPLTWTAAAAGGTGTLKYYFILYKDGTKITTRAYSTANTFTYTPAEPGTYRVRVYVKDAVETKANKLSGGVTATG